MTLLYSKFNIKNVKKLNLHNLNFKFIPQDNILSFPYITTLTRNINIFLS